MAEIGAKVKIDPGVRIFTEEAGILGMLVDDCRKEGDRGVKSGLFTDSPLSFINCVWRLWYMGGFVQGIGVQAVTCPREYLSSWSWHDEGGKQVFERNGNIVIRK